MDEEVKQAIDKLYQDINNGDKEAFITLGGILFYEMMVEEFYKHTNKKWEIMESIIKWRTGVPKEEGEYLVTLQTPDGNEVACISFEEYGWFGNGDYKVIAWCPMDEIKPYKE
jgi:hypothetical protein